MESNPYANIKIARRRKIYPGVTAGAVYIADTNHQRIRFFPDVIDVAFTHGVDMPQFIASLISAESMHIAIKGIESVKASVAFDRTGLHSGSSGKLASSGVLEELLK